MDPADIPPRLHISPPLFNSANPWATSLEDLRRLYKCASTGAVTTRTALLDEGFPHDDAVHRFAFFETRAHRAALDGDASLNTLGYSPFPLEQYLDFIRRVVADEGGTKPFIVSVTGSPDQVARCYRRVATSARLYGLKLAVEINLSCPNIPGRPPPAYEREALREYLGRVVRAVEEDEGGIRIPWGVKTPPYTHAGQFDMLVSVLRECARRGACPVAFVTATNTLGSCLVLGEDGGPGLDLGVGGVAGAPLHPLALGNVATLRKMLDEAPETRHVDVLGIGGVSDAAGYRRMRRVGAAAVGVGTALGIKGVRVFEEIEKGVDGVWDA
ncbi:hypothetical protein GGS21DRAFT_533390 [Xylaria nigripes]|nr:hypothetical protein GGS21DRAFT_533390 [Xylaria nigripes]